MKRRYAFRLIGGFLLAWLAVVLVRSILPIQPVTRTFPASGIKRVVIRAAQIEKAEVGSTSAKEIQVSGLPWGGARGYHSPDPFWRETPADAWGLDFIAKRYRDILVISTKHEINYVHHRYELEKLRILVPKGIPVIKVVRTLTGDGAPDLKAPNPKGTKTNKPIPK